MQPEPLEALIKGIVLYFKMKGVNRGSTSQVHKFYIPYVTRYPEQDQKITAWIMANRNNPYDPFGTIVGNDAASYVEFQQLKQVKIAIAQQRLQQEKVAHLARLQRDLGRIERNLPAAKTRNDEAAIAAMEMKRDKINHYLSR